MQQLMTRVPSGKVAGCCFQNILASYILNGQLGFFKNDSCPDARIFMLNLKSYPFLYKYFFPGAAAILGLGLTFRYRWICDDAFITFRYSRNLARGLGPVFNVEEKVEGYTNFLWMLLMSIPEYFHLNVISVAIFLGIIFYAAILYYIYKFSTALNPPSRFGLTLPIAFLAYAFHKHGWIYATSGLETSLFMLLVLAGFYHLFQANKTSRYTLAIGLLVLSAMTRPDGLLYLGMGGLFAEIRHLKAKTSPVLYLRGAFLRNLPVLLLFLPYWIWRYNYYGWIFPNTYYAKSGDLHYWKQGFNYTLLYFKSYWALASVFLLIPVYLSLKYKQWKVMDEEAMVFFFLLLIPSVVTLVYYTKIGGGFMFGRFLMPITPLLFLMIEYTARRILQGKTLTIFFALLLIGTLLRYDPFKGSNFWNTDGVTEEHDIYRRRDVNFQRETFSAISPYFSRARVAFYGSEAMIAYYLDPYYAMEAITGLTDEYLAHQKLKHRGMIGHEKEASPEYIKKRNVQFDLKPLTDMRKDDYSILKVKGIHFGGRILYYDNSIMEPMRKTDRLQFVVFPEYLDAYIKKMPGYSRQKIEKDYTEFKDYYFNHNNDPKREKAFLQALR